MDKKSNAYLETEPVGKLMRKYAIPCIISLLVAALYNFQLGCPPLQARRALSGGLLLKC